MDERTHERLTIQAAAQRLGISEGALRQRIKRGSVDSEKDSDGRVYVLVRREDADETNVHTETAPAELVDELRDRIAFLERQLEQEQRAHSEERRLLAAALERIPAIEAPQEATGGPETAAEEPYGTSPQEAEDSLHRRSWWQRWFGAGG
jgi:hypothetical protein